MKNIFLILLLCSFVGSTAYSQPSFGGSRDAFGLRISPSAVASGMGECGVSLVHAKSAFYNPGTLGLYALENEFVVSGFLTKPNYFNLYSYYNSNIVVPFQKYQKEKSKFLFAAAYSVSVTKLKDSIQYTTESFPDGTGYYFKPIYKNYNVTVAFGYIGKLQFGSGLTFRKIKERLGGHRLEEEAIDFGAILRYPIMPDFSDYEKKVYFIPSVGVSYSNRDFFKKYVIDGFVLVLPKTKKIGTSIKIGLRKKQYFDKTIDIVSILPSIDFLKENSGSWFKLYGIEGTVYEFISLRIGYNSLIGFNEGFSFDSKGLFSLMQGENSFKSDRRGLRKLLGDDLSFEYSYAHSETDMTYHELLIKIKL